MRIAQLRNRQCRVAVLLAWALFVVTVPRPARCQDAPAPPATSAEVHLGKGYDALKQDNYDLAASEFRAALNLDATLVLRARFPLAVALFEMHKADEARHEFETVRHEVGDHPNVLYYLGRLDLEAGDFTSAVRNLSKAAAKPPFPDTAYYLGFAYFKQGNLPAAEKWLKEAARLNPRDSRTQYQLGFLYRKEGREDEARKAMALSKDLRQREDNQSTLEQECAEKLEHASKQEAHAVCGQLYDPEDPKKLTALGMLYGQHDDLEAALGPLRRAAELSPQSPQMQYNLALTYYQMHQFEEARAPLADALKRWPDLFQLNWLYGAVLVNLGQDQAGYQALHRAHQINPEDPAAGDMLYLAALTLAKKSQQSREYSTALRYLGEASKVRPQEPEPHRRMAEIYNLTAQTAQATAEQREAQRLTKN
jgi:Flp pilus assembly protein TadD